MIISRPRGFTALLLGAALLAGAAVGSAAERSNRDLERLVSKGMYSASEGGLMQRAFASALHAGIDERDALELVEACVSGEFDASQILRMLSLATQLALEHLPVDSFIAKVEEGVSKRVDADRVVQAAERRGLMLNKAKVILNQLVLQGASIDDRDELLPELAAALEAGRSPEEAEKIISEALRSGEGTRSLGRKLFP